MSHTPTITLDTTQAQAAIQTPTAQIREMNNELERAIKLAGIMSAEVNAITGDTIELEG